MLKKGVDKKSKDKLKEENEAAASSAASAQLLSSSLQPSELEAEDEVELPPPMKPLQDTNIPQSSNQSTEDSQASAQGASGRLDDSGSVDYSDLEQIVKDKVVRTLIFIIQIYRERKLHI